MRIKGTMTLAVVMAAGARGDKVVPCEGWTSKGLIGASVGSKSVTYTVQECSEANALEDPFSNPCLIKSELMCGKQEENAPEYVNAHMFMSNGAVGNDCYLKLESGIDVDADKIECFTPPRFIDPLVAGRERCSTDTRCMAIGIYEVPNTSLQVCLLGATTSFQRADYPSKVLFRKQCDNDMDAVTFYGYKSQGSAPVGVQVLQSLPTRRSYSEKECQSMCDAIGSNCAGYGLNGSRCVSLYTQGNGGVRRLAEDGVEFHEKNGRCQVRDCGAFPVAVIAGIAGVVVAAAVFLVGSKAVQLRRENKHIVDTSDSLSVSSDNPRFSAKDKKEYSEQSYNLEMERIENTLASNQ